MMRHEAVIDQLPAVSGAAALLRSASALAAAASAGAVLFSFLAPISPLADSVAHFRLHLLGVLAAATAGLLALGPRRAGLAAAALVAATALFGFRPAFPSLDAAQNAAQDAAPAVSLLTLNLLYANAAPDAVLALIRREDPDLIALQEVSRRNRPLLDALKAAYPHQATCPFAAVGAVAVLSRLPPAGGADRGCAPGLGLVWLRVETEAGPATAASLHLHWPYPYSQGPQIDALTPLFEALPRPVLLGGDFNAAPWSHAVNRVAQATGARTLGGLRFTIHRRFAPMTPEIGIPIDHILADAALAPVSVTVSGPVGSDHRAVTARLARP